MIIDQQILHSNREINTELLFTTIDAIVITNHIFEIKKIKTIKKTLDAKEYVIDHLRLRRVVKKVVKLDKKIDKSNASIVERVNNREESEKKKKKKKQKKKK